MRYSMIIKVVWAWLPLLVPLAVAPANVQAPATINRNKWEDFYQREEGNLKALALAIEELDYLQEEAKCPSNLDYLNVYHRDPSYHIQPLIDKLFNSKVELGTTIDELVEDESDGFGTFFDEPEARLVHTTLKNLEHVAQDEKDSVDAFIAGVGHMSRWRYPDADDRTKNLRNLAMQIDDAQEDGPFLMEYVIGARANLQEIFDNLLEKLEVTVDSYDIELEVYDITDRGQLDEWFPKGWTYQEIIGALIRWTLCWIDGVKVAAEALRAVGPVPEPEPERPSRWKLMGGIGRALSTAMGGRGKDRSKSPLGGNRS